MTSPEREQPPSHRIHVASQSIPDRLDLERKVLAAAFKICFNSGDSDGAAQAHKGLCTIIQQQLFAGDSTSGSVIPASFWQQQDPNDNQQPPTPEGITGQTAPALPLVDIGLPADSPPVSVPAAAVDVAEQPEIEKPAAAKLPEIAPAGWDEPIRYEASADQPAAYETSDIALTCEIPAITEQELLALSQADPTAPLSYLDFGGEQEAAVPDLPPEPAIAETAPEPVSPSQLIKTQSFYQILGVSQVSSFEEIHTRFLRLMRRLSRSRYSAANCITDMREFREVLRAVCVAHDVLKDPVTRADYDLRQMGMRNDGAPEPTQSGMPAPRARLMIGELLECAQILEPAELQIALDMHKAEPDIQFGEFLVSAHFLSQDELDCALLAQRLIDSGKITVNQFRTGMYRMRDEGTAFFDTLMIEGWLSPSDIFDESSDIWAIGDSSGPARAPNTVSVPAAQQQLEAEEQRQEQPAVAFAKKPDLIDKWSEIDALAETQKLDLSAFRAAAAELLGEENTD